MNSILKRRTNTVFTLWAAKIKNIVMLCYVIFYFYMCFTHEAMVKIDNMCYHFPCYRYLTSQIEMNQVHWHKKRIIKAQSISTCW